MPHDGQVVRLTRCENVSGFPALLAAALSNQGCLWYPEYTVYEEYRDYGLSTFYCEVEIRDLAGDQIFYHAPGRGMTPEHAVQEAAYYALTFYRQECPYLGFDNSPFRYFQELLRVTKVSILGVMLMPRRRMIPGYDSWHVLRVPLIVVVVTGTCIFLTCTCASGIRWWRFSHTSSLVWFHERCLMSPQW